MNGTRPPKTALLVAQRIVSEIAERGLGPGDPLLPEREMLAEYGVARGTLREALRFLEMQNVISIKMGPGGGPVVSEISARPIAGTIALMSQLRRTPFKDVLEARLVLEPALAERAAARASQEEIEAIQRSVETMKAHVEDPRAFLDENHRFHSLIADAAGNDILGSYLGSLHWIIDATPLGADYTLPERRTVSRAHERIANAIVARDGEAAASAMRSHVKNFQAYLERRHPEILEMPLRWDQSSW
ncbi:MAG TPA: FCD domain-containing protein [Solirubrobacteraceae bacterium]|nr:FCD domain-containing protein [Solirubrobacteraceae bacterium]